MVGKNTHPMRVLIADNEPEVREALKLICEESMNLIVVGEASNSDELHKSFETTPADILLIDWDLPEMKLEKMVALHADYPLHIIVTGKRPELRSIAMESGADGFVYKGDPPDDLLNLLRHISDITSD